MCYLGTSFTFTNGTQFVLRVCHELQKAKMLNGVIIKFCCNSLQFITQSAGTSFTVSQILHCDSSAWKIAGISCRMTAVQNEFKLLNYQSDCGASQRGPKWHKNIWSTQAEARERTGIWRLLMWSVAPRQWPLLNRPPVPGRNGPMERWWLFTSITACIRNEVDLQTSLLAITRPPDQAPLECVWLRGRWTIYTAPTG